MRGMARYKELMYAKKHARLKKEYDECIELTDRLIEFQFLTIVLAISIESIMNWCKKFTLKVDFRDVQRNSIAVVKSQKIPVSDYDKKFYFDKLLHFHLTRPQEEALVKNPSAEHSDMIDNMELIISAQLIIDHRFKQFIEALPHRDEYVTMMNMQLRKINELAKLINVSKYQKFVGMNLKNWKKS
ncbi:MAG: hypothetical protein ACRCZ0_10000 [Cetobacterium sp.]